MFVEPIDEELERKLDEYEKVFSEGMPLMMFDGTREELIKTIDECIKSKKEYDTSFWDNNPDIET